MTFYVGEIRPFRWSEVKHITNSQDLRGLNQGDIVETFGHVFQWDQDCVPVELCERFAVCFREGPMVLKLLQVVPYRRPCV